MVAALAAAWASTAFAGTTGTLAGTVLGSGAAPLQGARVAAASPSQSAATTTDATGRFVFASLIPDEYVLNVSKDGYQSASQSGVLVIADNTQVVEFTLQLAVKTLGRVAVSENVAGLLRPGTTQSMYTITPGTQRTLAVLGGGTSLDQAYSAISSVPGAFVPPGQSGWNQPIFLRGGDFPEVGYELDGIPLNRAFDNIPTTNLTTLGQQQLQIYTGGAPADAESHGLAGYVNQVIKTGTVPGFASLSLAAGGPALYNKVAIEGGGATADRRFTYYVGAAGDDQALRYIDQFNGSQFSQTFGQPFDLANAAFGPLSPIGAVGCPILGGSGSNFSGCYANHAYFNALPAGPGGYIQGPYPNGRFFNATIADRENVVNLHYSIPHERIDLSDDIQLLYDVSQLYTTIYSSYLDWGGAGTWTALESATPGLHSPGSVPTFQSGFQYEGALGQPVAGTPFGPIAGMIPYLFPSEASHGLNGQIPATQRDGSSNAQALIKAQYQHNFSSDAYARVYLYSAYSNYFVHSPNGNDQLYIATSPDRELFTHTFGGVATYAAQLNSAHLVSVTASYLTSDDANIDNAQMTNSTPGAPFAPPQQSVFAALVSSAAPLNGICYAFDPLTGSAATRVSCEPATPVTPFTPTTTKFLTFSGPYFPPVPAGGCDGAPCEWLAVENGPSGVVNKVTPKFGAFSIQDQWRPADRIHVNAGVRLDDFRYDLSSTAGGPMTQYWFIAWNQVMCANAGVNGGVPIDKTTPAAFGGPGLDPAIPCGALGPGWHGATIANATPGSFDHTAVQPRLGATFESDPDDVLRLSAGSYAQPPPAQYEEYNTLQQNLAAYIGGLYYSLGYTTPAHDLNPSISYNYDLSWEHRFHRTDTSFKLTPFYRNTTNKVQQFFINPSTGTVSGVNAGKQRAYGAEFLLTSGDPNKDGFSALFSYTYTYSRVQYGTLPNGSTLLSSVNSSIQQYNSFTSACAGVAPSQDPSSPCGAFGGAFASPCFDPSTHAPAPACPAGSVGNPYFNAPRQPLLDPQGSYPSYDVVPTGTQLSSASYGVPNNATLALTYHHAKVTVTPLLTFISGSRYGAPQQQIGVDPSTCAALSGSAATDPRYRYGGVGRPYDATTCTNTIVIPDQFTGRFDAPGAFVEPSFLNVNAQIGYAIAPRVTAHITLANIVQSCFGGSVEPWTGGRPQCGYDVVQGHIPPVGNIYNPGDSIQRLVAYPYGNILTATPFNLYAGVDIKL